MFINEVTIDNIEHLTDIQLSDLLLRLLKFESEKFKFTGIKEIIVPLKINVADAGEDGRIKCDNTNNSRWIQNNFSLFQNKATDLQPKEVYLEFFTLDSVGEMVLKDQIKEVLDEGGQYIFFIGHSYNSKLIKSRLKKTNEAVEYCNKKLKCKYNYDQIRILEANQIKDWTNEYINAVVTVQFYCGINRPLGLKTVEQWGEYESLRKFEFVSNDKLNSFITLIKSETKKEKVIIRIIGHSGLGKSRLVYETFKTDSVLKNNVIYYDIIGDGKDIINFVRSYCASLSGTLILDNCDRIIHESISEEIKRSSSRLNLISIDTSVEEEYDRSVQLSHQNYIYLKSKYYINIIPDILTKIFGNKLNSSEITFISNYSEGYPGMAVLFSGAAQDGFKSITEFLNDDLIKKLLFGRDYKYPKNEVRYEIVKACSILSYFGTPMTEVLKLLSEDERDFLARQNEIIFENLCNPSSNKPIFHETCDYFINRQIFEKRGKYLKVRPGPLAIKLALEWWKYQSAEKIKSLFPLFEKYNMAIPLVEQLKLLDELIEAKEIVNELWGPKSPFGKAEVINTELGSRLFRSVVEVNPEATVETLEKVFLGKSKDELIQLKSGRRNLVWALEKLCFRNNTFSKAAKVLYAFAVAENESWGNNATGQFYQLFHTFLPGTEVNYDTRLEIIRYGLELKDQDYANLAINAILGAYNYHGSTRMGGAEKQGSGTLLVDYRPKSDNEILDYWNKILDILVNIWLEYPNFREIINKKFAKSIRQVINIGGLSIVNRYLQFLQSKNIPIPFEIIQNLKLTIKYGKLDSNVKNEIQNVINFNLPKDIPGRLISICVKPDWELEKNDKGEYVDIAKEKAQNLAKELMNEKVNLEEYLILLLQGKQMKTSEFAEKYGELIKDENEKLKLLEKMNVIMRTIPENLQNTSFLIGYLKSFSQEKRIQIIMELLQDPFLFKHSIILARFYFESSDNILQLFQLVDNKKIDIVELESISYGNFVYQLPFENIRLILDKFGKYGENGKWIILNILNQYCNRGDIYFDICKEYLKNTLKGFNYILSSNKIGSIDEHTWKEFVEKILRQEKDDEFATIITHQISEAFQTKSLNILDMYLSELSLILVDDYFKIFWKDISALILEDNIGFWNVQSILGADNMDSEISDKIGILFHNTLEYKTIIEWCSNNVPDGPLRIASMMPLKEEAKIQWHPFAVEMIEKFGNIKGFLEEISNHLGNFGFAGSIVPYYEDQVKLFQLFITQRSKSVKEWAKKNIEILEKMISREKIDEQDRLIGL